MKFEVKKDGVLKMHTEHEDCIPDAKTRAQLRKAGYKLYLDGKLFKEKKQ